MDDTEPLPLESTKPSLRQKTTRGVVWLVLQSLATRGVTMVQLFLLAWFLTKSDFGLIAMAFTVSTFVYLLANPGIDTVLVQRQRRFHQWATPAFWLGMTTGLVGMIVTFLAAPIAAWAYGQPRLVALICVMGLACPFQTLQIVPRAKLRAQLRFRTVVSLTFMTNVMTAVLAVALAYLGFGAYSIAVPIPIVAAAMAVVAWRVSRPTVHRHPHFDRWKYLVGDSSSIAANQVLQTLITQGDYLCLGLSGMSTEAIGVYYFAYRLSTQSFSMIASSVPAVLFPSLSQLTLDPGLQLRATMRAARLLALVAIPFCFLQVLLAKPMIRLFCEPPWLDAVLPLQILTFGIMVNAPAWPANSLMMAQRRFGELLRLSVICGITFFAAVGGALLIERSIVSVAIAVALWYVWATPYAYWVAVRPHVPWWGYFTETYRPFLAGLVPFVICAFLVPLFPATKFGDAAALVMITILFSPIYLAMLHRLANKDFNDLIAQVEPFLSRFKRVSTG